jgi:hypothetical protein
MSRRPRSPPCAEFTRQVTAPNTCRAVSVQAVTAHAAEHVHIWTKDDRPPAHAQVLLAAGRGPARLPTCEHILRHIRTEGAGASAPLLRRALSLFGSGELQALHVADAGSLELVLSIARSSVPQVRN